LVFSYLGVVVVLLALEHRLVFCPTPAVEDWLPPPSPEVQDVGFICADGVRVHAWWYPHPRAAGALLYLHGNAGNLSHRAQSIAKFHDGLEESVLIVDYPGYGRSGGRPSEKGCYAAADAAYDWLLEAQKVDPAKIILYGGSLGGGVAVDLASRRPHRAVVLVKTFTSAPDVACCIYPWLPARWLMRTRFDSLGKIGKIHQPVFIAHGTADALIPFEQGKRLYEAANPPKEFYTLDGADHNDPLPSDFIPRLKSFLHSAETATPAQN
jgi:fermentation-respiration switch protein FrsA (DUF1100 family)